MQNKIDTKISKEIYNVQKVLGVLAKQSQRQGQETGEKEKQERLNSNITNAIVEENKQPVDYKTKADWYASLLMYNSY